MRRNTQDSFFASVATRVADRFYDALKNGAIGTLLSKYENEKQLAERSTFYTAGSGLISRVTLKRFKYGFSASFERIKKLFGFDKLTAALLGTGLRSYSVGLLAFVICTSVSLYIKSAPSGRITDIDELLFIIGTLIYSLLSAFSGSNLSDALLQSRSANFILFSILGLRKSSFRTDGEKTKERFIPALVIGLLCGLIASTFSVRSFFIGAFLILIGYTIIVSPESGVIVMFLTLPFMTNDMVFQILLLISFSYAVKLFRGKRSLKFELFDVAVMIFAALMLFAGLFSIDRSVSLPRAKTMIAVEIGYILTVNLIKNKAWIHRSVSALICSSSIVGMYAVIQIILKNTNIASQIGIDVITPNITSFFDSPLILAQYSAISLLIFFAAVTVNKKTIRRMFFVVMCIAFLIIIYATFIRSVWISLLISVVIFFLICSRKTLIVLICSLPVIPILPYMLPTGITALFSELFTANAAVSGYRSNLLSSIFMMIKDNFISGCGIGGSALLYPRYAVEGIDAITNSGNLYFEVIINMGIFGLLVFFAIIFLFLQSNFSFYNNFTSSLNAIPACGVAAMIFILTMGLAEYPWQDTHIFLLFWVTLGISTAARRYATESVRSMDHDLTSHISGYSGGN